MKKIFIIILTFTFCSIASAESRFGELTELRDKKIINSKAKNRLDLSLMK